MQGLGSREFRASGSWGFRVLGGHKPQDVNRLQPTVSCTCYAV